MEFCFYCSRFPTPGQAWGCTPGNSRLGAAAYAALAGEASARPRRGVAPWAIRALGPGPRWGPFRADRGGSRDGGSTPRLWERLARVRAGGVAPQAIRACGPGPRWGPFRTDRGGSRDGGLTPRLCKASAHVRAGGVAPQAIRACGPGPQWGPFRTDRGGSRDGGLTPRLCKALAHVRAMGFGGRPPPGISPSLH